ncbi:cardiolipin synthase [Pseudohyphozyma bogoriensis]|nr:cardiolipin synthase [Pseudohyphozyma bogoriensis]
MPGSLLARASPVLTRAARPASSFGRLLSTTSFKGPAFCFDIDGVLKQGEKVLPEAKEALQILRGNNSAGTVFPFILCTNGGGTLESARAQKLTKELGVHIGEHQIVQSHTIFRALAQQYGDEPVLVVGGPNDNCRKVAEAYGFKQPYIPADILHWQDPVWPFEKLTERELGYVKTADFSKISFKAILVFHDTRDQLILDLLLSPSGVFGTAKDPHDRSLWTPENQIPLYFSNPDLLWGNEFPQPRLGQGAFQESVASVYRMVTGLELQRPTYEYTSSLLSAAIEAASRGAEVDLKGATPAPFEGRTYMVGDNPRSDIAGANAFGWESILVRTGVFRGPAEDAEHKPTVVLPNVLDGVKWALEREGHRI